MGPGHSVSRRAVLHALAFAGLAALSACATAPLPAEPVARGDLAAVTRQLEAYIAHELAAHAVAGLSIALVDDQRLVWARGFGWADVAAQRPAGPDTLYRMGSISKLLTDTAAMQLVAQQRLALDAPIEQAVPSWRIGSRWGAVSPGAAITPRQLMTHHSGLPRDVLGGMWGTPVGDFRAVVAAQAGEQTAAPPGQSFSYSNVGLDLLGTAVEQVTGVPFAQQLQHAVLAPLGMDGATFSRGPTASPQMARGHLQRVPADEPELRDVPAGGLTASVSDLAKFIAMQFADGRNARGEVVLPAAQVAEMLQVQNGAVPLDVDFRIGLGWMLGTFGRDTVQGGGPVAHHAGATFFHRSQLMMLPAQRLGVVVAANDGAAGPVVNRVAARALALLLEARSGQPQPPRVPGFVPARAPWTEAALGSCVGDYLTPAGVARVRLDGGRLSAELGGKRLDLLEGEGGWLGLRYRLGGLIPLQLEALEGVGVQCRRVAGRELLVARLDGQELRVGDRLAPPAAPLPAEFAALAGRWAPVLAPGERATMEEVSVLVDGGRLWVQPRLAAAFGGDAGARLPLQLLSDTQAVLLGPLADTGPLITRQRVDGEDRFLYSGWTFRRLP